MTGSGSASNLPVPSPCGPPVLYKCPLLPRPTLVVSLRSGGHALGAWWPLLDAPTYIGTRDAVAPHGFEPPGCPGLFPCAHMGCGMFRIGAGRFTFNDDIKRGCGRAILLDVCAHDADVGGRQCAVAAIFFRG